MLTGTCDYTLESHNDETGYDALDVMFEADFSETKDPFGTGDWNYSELDFIEGSDRYFVDGIEVEVGTLESQFGKSVVDEMFSYCVQNCNVGD